MVHSRMVPLMRLAQLLVLVGAALVPIAAPAGDIVAPEPFFQHDNYQELRLSPSGKYLGALVPSGGFAAFSSGDTALDTRDLCNGSQPPSQEGCVRPRAAIGTGGLAARERTFAARGITPPWAPQNRSYRGGGAS